MVLPEIHFGLDDDPEAKSRLDASPPAAGFPQVVAPRRGTHQAEATPASGFCVESTARTISGGQTAWVP
jgi:hypothetical protein